MACSLLAGCRPQNGLHRPAIQITRAPATGVGGPLQLDYIEGKVDGAAPDEQVVLYTRSGVWWIQPFRKQPFTRIQADGTWKNSTHLGAEYAALLVDSTYVPQAKLGSLPPLGNGVVAIATAKGVAAAPAALKTIHFSGYDWSVRDVASERGGKENFYDPANVWTDKKGYLHLHMEQRGDRWTCGEVVLNRSLGFGTYRFVVQDTMQLAPSAVVGLMIWDEAESDETRREMDIELSKWDNAAARNAQYVVQPYYLPGNVLRFNAPSGPLTHTVRWEPGIASFKSFRGTSLGIAPKSIAEHVFTAGIPNAGAEKVHLDLYEFQRTRNGPRHPAEVVIEKFEYLP
jgi:hypothetical protein